MEHLAGATAFPGSDLRIWDCQRRQPSLASNSYLREYRGLPTALILEPLVLSGRLLRWSVDGLLPQLKFEHLEQSTPVDFSGLNLKVYEHRGHHFLL